MNEIKKLAGQTVIYGLGSILPRVLNYLVLTTLYTSLFGKDPYGILSELYAWLVIVLVVIEFGMESGYFRFAGMGEDRKKVFSHTIGFVGMMAIVWMIMVYLFINPISGFIHYEDNRNYIIWMAWIVAIDSIAMIPFAQLRQESKALRFALLKLGNVLINIGLVLMFLLLFPWMENRGMVIPGWLYNRELGVGYVFLANLITSALMLVLLLPEMRSLRLVFDPALMKKLLAYSAPLVIVGLAGAINDAGDKVFVKMITGDQGQVGIYSANYRIAVMMTLFIQMFRYAFEPFLFAVSGDRKAPETYARVMKYFVITGLLVFLLTTLYIDFFKVILLRKTEFWEGLNVVPIVLMANLFLGIYYNLSVWYKVRDLTRYAAIMATIGALVTIVLNWTLVPRIGYMGSAWATLACYSVMMLISWLWGRKVYPIPYETKRIGLWMVFAVILYLISFFFRMDNLWVRLIMDTGLLLVFILLVGYSERAMLTPLLKGVRERFRR
ncbi:MAG: oligosaccharide flippase family protein [Bacteroidales bacterium]|nr:oligosaccharide flippase family protein [Bacteroidales bacterium]